MAQGSSVKLDDYREVAPRGAVDFLLRIGERLRGRRLVHVSASRYAGPIVETLNRLVPILNDLGVDTSWEVTIGGADFDTVTRSVGRALAGTEQVITEGMLARLRDTCADNARRLRLDADLVVVHDAGPLLVVDSRGSAGRWVWAHHGDLSSPQTQVWSALRPSAQRYDAAVFSLPKFAGPLSIPRFVIYPSVDPLSDRNREMTRGEQMLQLDRLHVLRDKPILLQVGPFERVGDPLGVVNAYRLVKKHHDVRLVLAGPPPTPGGGDALGEVQEAASRDPDLTVIVLPPDPQAELNALERAAAVVVHKPLETDFGIDVAAAMWKGKPVIGSPAGGIPFQIPQGVTGYVVETVEGAAFRIRHLLNNPELIGRMGAAGPRARAPAFPADAASRELPGPAGPSHGLRRPWTRSISPKTSSSSSRGSAQPTSRWGWSRRARARRSPTSPRPSEPGSTRACPGNPRCSSRWTARRPTRRRRSSRSDSAAFPSCGCRMRPPSTGATARSSGAMRSTRSCARGRRRRRGPS